MSAHTPGPWAIDMHFFVGPRSQDDDQSFGMVIPIADVYGDSRESDARLIAAAPELLTALHDLAEVFGDNLPGEECDALAAAHAAIAKATGAAA